MHMRRWKAAVGSITVGVALIAAGIFGADGGPDVPRPLWTAPDADAAVDAGGVVVTRTDRRIAAYDADTGETLWTSDSWLHDVWLDDEVLIGVDDDRRAVTVLDLRTGVERLAVEDPAARPVEAALVGDVLAVLFVVDEDGARTAQRLDGVSVEDGSGLWSEDLDVGERHRVVVPGGALADRTDLRVAVDADVLLDTMVDVVASDTLTAVIRDADTGAEIGELDRPAVDGPFGLDLAITDETLSTTVRGDDGCPVAVHSADRTGAARASTIVDPRTCSADVDGSTAPGVDDGTPVIDDLSTGDAVWRGDGPGSAVALLDTAVLCRDGVEVELVDTRDGATMWSARGEPTGAALVGRTAVVGAGAATTAVDIDDGESLWSVRNAAVVEGLTDSVLMRLSTDDRAYLAALPIS